MNGVVFVSEICVYIYIFEALLLFSLLMMNTLSRVKVMNEGEYFMRFTCDWFLL